MMEYYGILKSVPLFAGIDADEFNLLLDCIEAQVVQVKKDEIILHTGEKPKYVGIVLMGQLHINREDYDGNRALLAAISIGDVFAEAICCAGVSESPVTVKAEMDSTVMLMSFSRLLQTCPHSCSFHAKLIENMLKVIANKNLHLQGQLEIVGLKSIREKVMRYLESLVFKQGKNITIPFNREELANYLCVERSALSHELARMKRDGLIDYKKNVFILE